MCWMAASRTLPSSWGGGVLLLAACIDGGLEALADPDEEGRCEDMAGFWSGPAGAAAGEGGRGRGR